MREENLQQRLVGIRKLFLRAQKPKALNSSTWNALRSFFSLSPDKKLREFISRFEWGTGGPTSESASQEAERALIKHSFCSDQPQAKELYCRLFLHVVTVLSQPGRKQLIRKDLLDQAKLPTLSERDRARLDLITARVFDLETRVSSLEQYTRESEKTISSVTTAIQHFLPSIATAQFFSGRPKVDTHKPIKGPKTCERRQTVSDFLNKLAGTTWMSIYGGFGCGKSQLCMLLAGGKGPPTLWIPMRDLSSQEAAFFLLTVLLQFNKANELDDFRPSIDKAVNNLDKGTLVILDDLPRIEANTSLSNLLLQFATACHAQEITILSSSHYRVPTRLGDSLSPGSFCNVLCPRFKDNDAAELFRLYGSPQEFTASGNVSLLNNLAQGHPTLLVAMARYLSSAGWDFGGEILFELRKHVHEGEVINEATRRLLVTVEDQDARELLYRLCLILGNFGFDDVQTVAAVAPLLRRPRERLNKLLGLWVEEETGRRMTVNPLVKPISKSELELPLQDALYEALADQICHGKELSVLDVAKALHYLKKARAFNKAGYLLIQALSWKEEMPREQLAFLLSSSLPNEALPLEMNLGVRIYLKAHQIVALHKLDQNIDGLLSDALGLLDIADDESAWAVFGFAVVAVPVIALVNFKKSVECLLRGLRAFPGVCNVDKRGFSLPETIRPEKLIWLNTVSIKSAEDFLLWVGLLKELDPATRLNALTGSGAEHACQLAVDQVWKIEHEKPEDTRKWNHVLNAYDAAMTQAVGFESKLLWVLLIRARAIVLAEYLDDIDSTVSCVNEGLCSSALSASLRFLLYDILGRQFVYKKRYTDALPWLHSALAEETKSFVWIRCRTFLEASRAVGDTDCTEAVNLAENAVKLVRQHPKDISELEMVVALGELSIARWLQTNMEKAFEAYDEAGELLLRIQKDSVFWKQLFVVFCNIGGYLTALAITGEPPDKTIDGHTFATPHRGILLGFNPQAAELYSEQRLHLFHSLMSSFAEAVGNNARSAFWALRGIDSARKAGMLEAVSLLGRNLLPVLIENNRFVEAIDIAMEFCISMRALIVRRDQGMPSLQSGLQPFEILGPKPSLSWNSAERDVAIQALPAVVAKLGEIMLKDRASAKEHAMQISETCEHMADTASDPELWRGAAKIFRASLVEPITITKLHEMANGFAEAGYDPLLALAYLGVSLLPDVSLEDALIHQSVATKYWARLMGYNSITYKRSILTFLTAYWSAAVERESFRFTPPSATKDAIVKAARASVEHRAQELLKCVLSGLGTSLPSNLDEIRAWLKDG